MDYGLPAIHVSRNGTGEKGALVVRYNVIGVVVVAGGSTSDFDREAREPRTGYVLPLPLTQ